MGLYLPVKSAPYFRTRFLRSPVLRRRSCPIVELSEGLLGMPSSSAKVTSEHTNAEAFHRNQHRVRQSCMDVHDNHNTHLVF